MSFDFSARTIVLGILFLVPSSGAGEPDPRTLLEGVTSHREQTPPSLLHVRWTYEEPQIKNVEEYLILFDGERRFVLSTNSSELYRAMFDGRDAFIVRDNSIIVRDGDTPTLDRLFDPRILGITSAYSGTLTPQGLLDAKRGLIRLIGQEQIQGKSCWRVRQEEESRTVEIWIDPESNFAVYQYEVYDKKGSLTSRVRSFYRNAGYPWLPSRIVQELFSPPGLRTVEVLDARTVEHIPRETWTLAGLLQGLTFSNPVMVTDVRKGEFIGTWDGQRLIPYHAAAPRPSAPPFSPRRVLVLLVLAGLVIFPLALLWLRKQKPSQQPRGGVPS